MHLRRSLCAASLIALCAAGAPLIAGKPSGGGGAPIPPGFIDYSTYKRVYEGGFWNSFYSGDWSMRGDGSGKQAVVSVGGGDPSHELHNNIRWWLQFRYQNSFNPDGTRHAELSLADEDGTIVQLSDEPLLQPFVVRFARDDSFVSFVANIYTPVAPGQGTIVDAAGQSWNLSAGLFSADIDWTGAGPTIGPLALELDDTVIYNGPADFPNRGIPGISGFDWSPAGNQVVYCQSYQTTAGGTVNAALHVTTFGGSGDSTLTLGSGANPAWSPVGNVIAFAAGAPGRPFNAVIWTVHADGTGLHQASPTSQDMHYLPQWSPDGAFIAFQLVHQTTQKGITVYLKDILRIPATGGSPINLTADVADDAYLESWR